MMKDQYGNLPSIEVKEIVDYMKEITSIVEKISEMMESLDNRVTSIEANIKPQNKVQRGNSIIYNLPELPKVNFTPKSQVTIGKREPELQTELKSVLTAGVGLKPVAEAKKEEQHKLQTVVHAEFKNLGFDSRMKEVQTEKSFESEYELKRFLQTDLEEALGELRRKFKR